MASAARSICVHSISGGLPPGPLRIKYSNDEEAAGGVQHTPYEGDDDLIYSVPDATGESRSKAVVSGSAPK